MGRNFASDLTETSLTLEQQIAIHFSSNCYPPVPQFMVSVAVEAINAVKVVRSKLIFRLFRLAGRAKLPTKFHFEDEEI